MTAVSNVQLALAESAENVARRLEQTVPRVPAVAMLIGSSVEYGRETGHVLMLAASVSPRQHRQRTYIYG